MRFKSKILVLLAAVCVLAAPETLQKSSAEFSFVQGVGVIYQKAYFGGNSYFLYKRVGNLSNSIMFYWSLPELTGKEKGKISIFSVSGKLINSFNIKSSEGKIVWKMANNPIGRGIYFAVLSYGPLKKNVKILY
jgi:hypothetical protein